MCYCNPEGKLIICNQGRSYKIIGLSNKDIALLQRILQSYDDGNFGLNPIEYLSRISGIDVHRFIQSHNEI